MALADRALVVGINRYPGLTALSGAENDAVDFYNWVTSSAGGAVKQANAVLLLSSTFPSSANADTAQPAKEKIEEFFTDVDNCAEANNTAGNGLKAGSRLWLFFSGHGFAPSLDRSGVLMANATLKKVHNVAATLWANRLYEGGWFDDVFLFQDACRSRISDADLNPPFLRPHLAPTGQQRRRFYAFSAKNNQVSKEIPFPDGTVRGVFTTTLMQGLRGLARDPRTGTITTAQLKAYLQDNMRKLLTPADLQDDEVAKMPEIFDPDPFDIVLAPSTAAVSDLPVHIRVATPGQTARIVDSNFQEVAKVDAVLSVWSLRLQRGIYKVIVSGVGEKLFQVTGAVMADGREIAVDVSI